MLNLLIVDDSAVMRAMLRRVAEVCGAPVGRIHEAANGAEALRVLERYPVDVLFTDINMPGMSGPDLLREIDRRGGFQHVTRVIISTDGSAARRDEVRDLNVRLYVEKPLRPETMRDVLTTLTAASDPR